MTTKKKAQTRARAQTKAQTRTKAKAKKRGVAAADRHSLAGQLRHTITTRRLTAYAVAKAAGVDIRVVQRFLDAERDLRLATADKIARALGLRLVEAAPRRAPGRARPKTAAGGRR
jgi:DNA-binding phage protein